MINSLNLLFCKPRESVAGCQQGTTDITVVLCLIVTEMSVFTLLGASNHLPSRISEIATGESKHVYANLLVRQTCCMLPL